MLPCGMELHHASAPAAQPVRQLVSGRLTELSTRKGRSPRRARLPARMLPKRARGVHLDPGTIGMSGAVPWGPGTRRYAEAYIGRDFSAKHPHHWKLCLLELAAAASSTASRGSPEARVLGDAAVVAKPTGQKSCCITSYSLARSYRTLVPLPPPRYIIPSS